MESKTSTCANIGLTVSDAFLDHNLAPLCLRRDIDSLGCLHQIVLGLAHPEFGILFPAAPPPANAHATRLAQSLHSCQLLDRCDGSHSQQLARSLFGLVRIYSLLPQYVVNSPSVNVFQTHATEMARARCRALAPRWERTCSCRSFT